MELSDAMRTTHANRYYTADPVPDDVLYRAFDNARFGPQGGNRQPLRFLIITDQTRKSQLGQWYRQTWNEYRLTRGQGEETAMTAADDFAEHFGEHPAIIVALADLSRVHATDIALDRLSVVGGASIYPMVQNLCLALRDQGVATTLTTLLCAYEPQVKELLEIPEHLSCAAFIVAGYPNKPFPTKLRRRSVAELAFVNSLDNPLTGS